MQCIGSPACVYAEVSDSFDWASYLMEGIEYPSYSDTDEVRRERE